MEIVVIGGIAAGPSFATRLRRLNEKHQITIYERSKEISIATCAMPYVIGGLVEDRQSIVERTPEQLKAKNNIDVKVRHEVEAIDPKTKTLTVKDLTTGETFKKHYDRLILATGARPALPNIPGARDADIALQLRNTMHLDEILDYMKENDPKSAVIIGAGLQGIEVGENLIHRGIDLTMIDSAGTVAAPYDEEVAELMADTMTEHGAHLKLNTTVTEIKDHGHTIVLDNGETIQTDMLLFMTGVTPNNEVLKAAGVEVTEDGHVPVDDQLRTNIPDIFAIGDIIQTKSLITGRPINSVLSSAANRQGHLLADIVEGEDLHYPGFIWSSVAKVFDHTASFVGYTESMLQQAGITDYDTVLITPFDHAYFYPGASRITFKLLFDPKTGRLYGGQAYGKEGVDKRIAELSVAISGNLTVWDLPQLELPYSPPYSATRDVLNVVGYVAINHIQNRVENVPVAKLTKEDLDTGYFLDIRESDRPEQGTIAATQNIPFSELRDRIDEIPTDKPVYITFRKGIAPYNAARILSGNGIDAKLIKE
ncbi:MAG: FAD-dependent oxidoreductase [Aerococcus sp.]|nr:FAD-dependent oxidoreductase [Aerococcus sp.]